jgi:FkbM family methyltransferase
VMLRIEQGLGDTIQFLRYAPRLKALGATVLLRKFSELAHSFPGVDRVIEGDESPEFDYYIPLLSLPRVFETDLASIPSEIPYLKVDSDRIARWADRMSARGALRVGLVWAGNPAHPRDRERSMPLRLLAPIIELDAVCFFALQKGTPATDAAAYVGNPRFVNLGPELEDFADCAAVITQLDLLICVDTAVAHLAGALGKPVWLMVQKDADWRWLEGREDSPWYPTMRLFRQRPTGKDGDWNEVIARIRKALQELAATALTGVVATREAKPAKRVVDFAQIGTRSYSTHRRPAAARPGLSAVAETRVGIVQYLPDEPIVGDSIGWYGELLQQQLNLLAGLVRRGATVLEAGAGVGAHSLFLARAIGAEGHLFLFESRPVVRTILRQNLSANQIMNVTLMSRPLGRGEPAERVSTSAAPGSGAMAPASPKMPRSDTIDELQLDKLRLLKINDSVQAPGVLAGAAATLWRLRPFLFVGTRDQRIVAESGDAAKACGYRCWRLSTPLFDPQNFNHRDTDIFSGKHAIALLAIPEEIEVNMATDQCVEL